eukprot:scaffold20155_cov64-Phaeocystis_antarctica.AAC.3
MTLRLLVAPARRGACSVRPPPRKRASRQPPARARYHRSEVFVHPPLRPVVVLTPPQTSQETAHGMNASEVVAWLVVVWLAYDLVAWLVVV